jgi:hypothetical protein
LTVLLGYDNSILGGIFDCSGQNSTSLAVRLMELDELGKRVVADDIRVEHEKKA